MFSPIFRRKDDRKAIMDEPAVNEVAFGGVAMSNNTIICLEDRVQDAIDHNPYLTKKNLRCETSDGHVVLRGQVRSFFQKQMAQESVKNIDGIVSIQNCLEVVD